MKMKKSLAWILALVLIIGSVNPVFAMDNQLFTDGDSLNSPDAETKEEDNGAFTDGEETAVPDVTETPKMQDAPEETKEAGALLGDPPEDTWAEATVITELDKEVKVDTICGDMAYYSFTPMETGTYRLIETVDENQYYSMVKMNAGEKYELGRSIEKNPYIIVKIEKAKTIIGIETDIPENIRGYAGIGETNLYAFLNDLNPKMIVTYEDGSKVECYYSDRLENCYTFEPFSLSGEEIGELQLGEHEFYIALTYDTEVKTSSYTYSLMSMDEERGLIPILSETGKFNVYKDLKGHLIYKLQGDPDKGTQFLIKYEQNVLCDIYNNGLVERRFEGSFGTVSVPAGKTYYIKVYSYLEEITSNIVEINSFVGVWNGLVISEKGEYDFVLNEELGNYYYFNIPETGFYCFDCEFQSVSQSTFYNGTSFYGNPLYLYGEKGQRVQINIGAMDTAIERLKIKINKLENIPEMQSDNTIILNKDAKNEAVFAFRPLKDGVYRFDVPEEAWDTTEGYSKTRISVIGKNIFYEADMFNNGFELSAGVDYRIILSNLNSGVSTFTVRSIDRNLITAVRIKGNVDELQKEWLYNISPWTFGLDVLELEVVFVDGGSTSAKVGQEFDYKGESYVIGLSIEKPPIINNNDEERAPGKYVIKFDITENCCIENVSLPDPITMWVKRTNELAENTYPVLAFGEEYSLEEFKKNYNNNTAYVFQLRPKITGEYDFNEFFFSALNNGYDVNIVSPNGDIGSYSSNSIGLDGGENYCIVLSGGSGSFDFTLNNTQNEILSFELTNPELLDNVELVHQLVNEYVIKNILKDLKFKVVYKDSSGQEQTEEIMLNDSLWDSVVHNINVLYEEFPQTTGTRELTFVPNGMESLKLEKEIQFYNLNDVVDSMPQIQADGNETILPENNNPAKYFTFTAEESGTYVMDFGIQCVVSLLDELDYGSIVDDYSDEFRFEANKGVRYIFCVTPQYSGEELDAISLKRYESLNKLEIVNKADIPKKWGQYLGVPEDLKEVKIRYTLNNGDTGEIYYGQELSGYGRMEVMAVDSEFLGDFELYFYFENMPEVTSEKVPYSCVLPSQLGLPQLELDKDIIIKKGSEYFWITTFTPDHDGTFYVKFSEAIEDGDVYTEDEEYFQPFAGSDFTGEFTKDTTYVFRMRCSDPDTKLSAKIVETTVRSISLDTSELTIAPGQTGTVIALLEPVTATEKLEWKIEPADSGFSIESTDNSSAVIKAADNIGANKNANLIVTSKETGHEAECILETANITTDVDKINSNVTEAPTKIKAGIAVDTSGSDKESDAKKAENDLKEIISNTADSGNAMSGVEFVPEESTENVAEKIKENIDQGGSIVTTVKVESEEVTESDPTDEVAQTVQSQLPNTEEDALNVEKKLDITIDVSSINSNNATEKIGSITQLPKDKAITFTVLLTEAQMNKKMYVAYSHNDQIKMIPESDVTQNGAVLTFKANQFSDYFLVSRSSEMKVTYKNTTPGGNVLSINSDFGAKLTEPTITVPSNYEFKGWKVEGTNQYWDFDTDVVKTDLTLVGVWSYDPPEPSVTYYSVRFDSQGGTNVSSQSLTYGSKVKEPSVPEKEGFIFGGWYKEASCKNSWDFAKDTVTSSVTLYAKWTEEPEIIPETPQIKGHTSQKGYLKIELTGAAKDTDYYEYAYSTKEDWVKESDYTVFAQTKNTSAESTKIPAGVYVVKVRSVKQSEEKKIYSSWSSAEWVELPTGVLSAPKILSVKIEKNTVTVVLDRVQGSEGYDCVLGNSTNPVKPVDYAYVEKNQRTTTIVFKNVADGHYYIGSHAYVYEKGTKVFSKWSNQMEITVDSGEMPEITDLGQPEILKTYSNKGCLKIKLAKPVKDADGYEYAYSTNYGEWLDNDFTVFGRTTKGYCETSRISAGIYTVRARAYQNVDGKRVYGEWSDARWIEIPTASAQLPEILKVKVSKNTVTVTVKKIKGAKGYDCVLGSSCNPIKPTDYEYVEKNKTATTIVFKNVKEGTYYLGTHAYNIRGGKKIFSKWSGVRKVTVK